MSNMCEQEKLHLKSLLQSPEIVEDQILLMEAFKLLDSNSNCAIERDEFKTIIREAFNCPINNIMVVCFFCLLIVIKRSN